MIDHLSFGMRNLAAARRFYDRALGTLGYKLLAEYPGALGYGDAHAEFWLLAAERPVPADDQSGLHLSFHAPSRAAVDAFHAAALAEGGSDNGKPGLRTDYGPKYYAAFVKDPEGYRIEAHYGA